MRRSAEYVPTVAGGLNDMAMVQVFPVVPAGTVNPVVPGTQVVPVELIAKSEALGPSIAVTVTTTGPVPVFVKVTVCAGGAEPLFTAVNDSVLGLKDTAP